MNSTATNDMGNVNARDARAAGSHKVIDFVIVDLVVIVTLRVIARVICAGTEGSVARGLCCGQQNLQVDTERVRGRTQRTSTSAPVARVIRASTHPPSAQPSPHLLHGFL